MPAFRSLIQGLCFSTALSYHVDFNDVPQPHVHTSPNASAAAFPSPPSAVPAAPQAAGHKAKAPVVSETQMKQTAQKDSKPSQGPSAHTAVPSKVPHEAASHTKPTAHAAPSHAHEAASHTKPTAHAAPSHAPSAHKTPTVAAVHSPKQAAAANPKAHNAADAKRALHAAEHDVASRKVAAQKAGKTLEAAQHQEKAAKDARETALKELRLAKEKRASDYKRAKINPNGDVDIHADDKAISKAQRSFSMATAKWQRSKESTVKASHAVKPAEVALQQSEVAKDQASSQFKHIEVAEQAAAKDVARQKEQAKREFQVLKEKAMRLRQARKDYVAQFKQARKERLSKQGKLAPKDLKAMQAREARISQSVRSAEAEVERIMKTLNAQRSLTKTASFKKLVAVPKKAGGHATSKAWSARKAAKK